jgi:multisubunit Na+/H+ antiporter MnhB subunit
MARRARSTRWVLAALGSGLVGLALLLAALELPSEAPGLREAVLANLVEAGVKHPVTAVLLDFRAYDTWLEVGVLFLAALAVLTLRRIRDARSVAVDPPASPVLAWLVRLLAPVMVLSGGYLLWLGTTAPGGAFQGGVLLGAAGVLLGLAGFATVSRLGRGLLHLLLLLGFMGFLALALVGLLTGAPMLAYPEGWEAALIVLLESLIALSVAVTVTLLVFAATPKRGPG